MSFLEHLAQTQPIAHAIFELALVAVLGLALGSVTIRGIRLGTAGVLFAGIVIGHFGQRIDHQILAFSKEFGLILFVFAIGLQLGPGFFAALRRQGLRLNLLAASVVLLGAGVTLVLTGTAGLDPFAALGIFSGATTNTPSLGATQQVLATLPQVAADKAALPALAYALSYPVAIAGIILTLLLLAAVFRIDPRREAAAFAAEERRAIEPLEHMHLIVENRNLDRVPVGELPGLRETGVVVSRIRSAGETEVRSATETTVLHVGDVILAVGTHHGLEQFRRVVGSVTGDDLTQAKSNVTYRRLVVTHKAVLGKTIGELGLGQLYGVTVPRLRRAEVEMTAQPHIRLQFGDVVAVVGPEAALDQVARKLGNSLKALNETQFIPIFLGIALGVLAGVQPFNLLGLPVPVRLGLAGGPLLAAILLGRLGQIGRLVWYMPATTNLAFRELGITLFLACVGLETGERFFATALSATGLRWLLMGATVTILPLLAIGVVARVAWKLNFVTLCGLLAGSMTDPPALAFANALAGSDAPTVSYATVYPLTMLLRILVAQVLAIALCT